MESLVNYSFLHNTYRDKKYLLPDIRKIQGAWLSSWLATLGPEIKGYALEPKSDKDLFNYLNFEEIGESIMSDIRNKEQLEEKFWILSRFHFHLAAQPLVRRRII